MPLDFFTRDIPLQAIFSPRRDRTATPRNARKIEFDDELRTNPEKIRDRIRKLPGPGQNFGTVPRQDSTAWEILTTIDRRLGAIHEKVQDNRALAGSEAFAQARDIYHSAGRAAKAGVPGAKTAYEDLRRRYPGFRGERNAPASPA